jgi:hypothetical protein
LSDLTRPITGNRVTGATSGRFIRPHLECALGVPLGVLAAAFVRGAAIRWLKVGFKATLR